MAQFGRPRHIGGRPGDPFGHFGDRALQPVERPQHPSRQRSSDHRGQDEERETADRHPEPALRDVARCDRRIDSQDHGADQLTVVADTRGGEKPALVPRENRCPA